MNNSLTAKEQQEKIDAYLSACEKGELNAIEKNVIELELQPDDYFFKAGFQKACDANQTEVFKFLLNLVEKNYKPSEFQLNYSGNDKTTPLERHMFSYGLDLFRTNNATIASRGNIEILKLISEKFNGIKSENDFEKCACFASSHGQLEMVKYLLTLPIAKTFQMHKYYNQFFVNCSDPKSNIVIKYFLDNEELSKNIKQLALLETAHQNNNVELIEYLIFDKNMLYSKKVKKHVENMTHGKCNIPQLFENRERLYFAQKLDAELSKAENEIPKPKPKI